MASIQINLDAINNNVDDLSFGLLRANPALSTNVKLVVDSDGAVFMDSFIANKELANNNYRKYPINTETGAYSFDVATYFGNLKTLERTHGFKIFHVSTWVLVTKMVLIVLLYMDALDY